MNSWRDLILNDFVPQVSKLTLVADPDDLLSEEKLAVALRQRGFDLIEFTDPVAFRYAYESNYRSIWDRGEYTDLVVILRLQDISLDWLPHDLLQVGRRLAFNLGELFPTLSYPVIEQLDPSLLDGLYEAMQRYQPDRLGDNGTMDFILRHVFGVAGELITSEVDLLRVLLRLHYGSTCLPTILSDRLVQTLQAATPSYGQILDFNAWPLAEIVADSEAFFTFLQERWPIFLEGQGAVRKVGETGLGYGFAYPGPALLPFDHHDIRVYIDNLFVEGKLTPVEQAGLDLAPTSWIRSGLREANSEDKEVRITRLFDLLAKESPSGAWRYSDWTEFAMRWAELAALIHTGSSEEKRHRFLEMGDRQSVLFTEWLRSHFAGLITLPPSHPAMLHHILRRLAREHEDHPGGRVALVVVDGLALDQWVTVRQILQKQLPHLIMRESAVFAWVPTLTAVSRQTIFAGRIPRDFPLSINTTNNEGGLWKQVWEEAGLSRAEVAYQRGLGDGDALQAIESTLHPGQTKIIGLVVDKVDKITHGMQLGAAGMHGQIKQWCEGGFLGTLIDHLLEQDFAVWLTSDHGNIECVGQGRPSEGVLADTRGQRVRVYPTSDLRAQMSGNFPFAHEWTPVGLPPGYYPLTISGREAFVTPGERIVSHGGIAIEEVIVPLVKIERRSR